MRSTHGNLLDDPHYRAAAVRILLIFVLAAGVVLSLRLFHLQVIRGSYHKSLSEQNSIRLQVVKAPRGLIYDRNGVIIARNRPSYQIAILPTELRRGEPVLERLLRFRTPSGERLFDSQLVAWSLERARWRRFQPLVIYEDAPFEVVSLVEEHQTDLPGVVTLVESRRNYPFGPVAGHVLGYMDEVKEEEVGVPRGGTGNADSLLPYARGDRIGRKGLERQYERHFRGRDGVRYVKVNAFGKQIEVISGMPQRDPRPGRNIYTTLDMNLQVLADSLLGENRGAVVVLDPRNGEILAMASSPRLDGNVFSLSRSRRAREWAQLALDPARPLHNRAIHGGYEPASTFKGVVSLAGFEAGINPAGHMARSCNGGYRFGNRVWRCWDEKGHGFTNAVTAFTHSCDVYYYQVGLIVGMDAINKVARRLGFGAATGVDLDDDRSGLLMDSATYEGMYRKRLGWRWTRGLVLNLSIGQGQIVTPLQLADYAAGMANGDVIYRPHFLREVRDVRGHLVAQARPNVLHKVNFSAEERALITKSLSEVVNGAGGTGGRARVPGVWVGGKTGSAENPHGEKTHGLFIGVAPLDAPRIAVAVVLENAGHGGSVAAPIAGAIMRRYLTP